MYNKDEFKNLVKNINEIKDSRIQKILLSIILEVTENNDEVKDEREMIIIQTRDNSLNKELIEKKLIERITKVMLELGIPAHLRGYKYIREAIRISIIDIKEVQFVTKKLYPDIANKFQTTPSGVERGIRHAIEVSWVRGNAKYINELFGYTIANNKGKPTNSEFIATISDKIRLELNM